MVFTPPTLHCELDVQRGRDVPGGDAGDGEQVGMAAGWECRCIYFMRANENGRGVAIFVECDARQSVAAVAEPLSSVAIGDLFGAEGGDGGGARFLEYFLAGEEAVSEISAMDA